MPLAVCTECGRIIRWRNRRGSRLADCRCKCGSRFRLLPYRECAECAHAQLRTIETATGGIHKFYLPCGDVCLRIADARRADHVARPEG